MSDSQLIRIIKIKDTVRDILIDCPATRDNDRLLLLKVWAVQYPRLRDTHFAFVHFSNLLLSGKLADSESVRRSRQKLQQDNPELRGGSVGIRSDFAQEMKSNIKEA